MSLAATLFLLNLSRHIYMPSLHIEVALLHVYYSFSTGKEVPIYYIRITVLILFLIHILLVFSVLFVATHGQLAAQKYQFFWNLNFITAAK